jgi:hypothetical protein
MTPLLHQLAIATALVSVTVVIHLVGLDLLQAMVRWHLRRFGGWVSLDRVTVPLGIVLGLFVLHGVEIWLYALFYWLAHVLGSLETALYYAISAYSTLGETGTLLPKDWRIVGVLEAINGMLLIGWSTAFLFQALNHLMWEDDETQGPLPRGAIARRSGR